MIPGENKTDKVDVSLMKALVADGSDAFSDEEF
jgi:hypothetical protein